MSSFFIGNNYINIVPGNIHIHDSYKIKTSVGMKYVLGQILAVDDTILKTRSKNSLLREWKAHNVFYALHIARKSAMHTDLEYKQSLFHKISYFIVSLFYWK